MPALASKETELEDQSDFEANLVFTLSCSLVQA